MDDWFRWPTNSNDPALNAAVAVLLAMVILTAVIVGAMFLVPIAILAGVAKGIHWYVNRPTPTSNIFSDAQQRAITANFPDLEDFLNAHIDRFLDSIGDDPPAFSVYVALAEISEPLYTAERLTNPLPPFIPSNTIEEGRYRDQLLAHQRKTADPKRTLDVFNSTLGTAYLDFISTLPPIAKATRADYLKTAEEDEPTATLTLVDLLPNPGASVWNLISPFFTDETEEIGLFVGLRKQLNRNLYLASGVDEFAPVQKLITPDKYKGTGREIVSLYLRDTPLMAPFYAPIPFALSDARRFEHMHVVGGSGHGKTQFLQYLILNDLKRSQPPALVIIDSQGEMLRKIEQLEVFAPGSRFSDRLIVIDPEDVDHPPALNMFDLKAQRLGTYDQSIKEQIEASTIELFNYIFGALAAELTSRQNTTFAFVTRLLLSIPGATIHTLRELFEDGAVSIDASPFADHIRKLDPTSQAYFENQFFTRTYSPTKQQIARRLYGVLQVPAFDRMFAASTNKLDMFTALQSGSIVLVNTSKALLKADASALFGRTMIARVIAAAFERVALSPAERNPAYLIVDEAAEYFDENLETLLSQARKFNVGVVFAHQHLDQLTTALRGSVAANTSIKLAGGISDRDARALAPDMRTTPDFIADMTKRERSTDFACFVRNYTANAVRLTIPFGTLEAAPKMSQEALAEIVAANRRRYASERAAPRPAATSPDTSGQVAPPEIADDWRS